MVPPSFSSLKSLLQHFFVTGTSQIRTAAASEEIAVAAVVACAAASAVADGAACTG